MIVRIFKETPYNPNVVYSSIQVKGVRHGLVKAAQTRQGMAFCFNSSIGQIMIYLIDRRFLLLDIVISEKTDS